MHFFSACFKGTPDGFCGEVIAGSLDHGLSAKPPTGLAGKNPRWSASLREGTAAALLLYAPGLNVAGLVERV